MEEVRFILGNYTQEVFYLLAAIIFGSMFVAFLLRRFRRKKLGRRFDDPKE
jgi:hypothetical protein